MPQRPDLLQLERDEDVASLRARLLPLLRRRVLLVWPVRGSALTRRLDLVLVQREAARLGIQLALLTQDPDVIRHAREMNLSTFATVGASERGRWKRGRSRMPTPARLPEYLKPPVRKAPEPPVTRARPSTRRPAPLLRATGVLTLLLVVSALGAVAALLILPTATITILPARNMVAAKTLITANPAAVEIDLENAVIPATRLSITVEESASMPPGGRRQLSATPARGSVIFVNESDAPVAIPAETRVGTDGRNPVWFRTLSGGTLPAGAGQQLELPVVATAEHTGVAGNLDSGSLSQLQGALAQVVSVRNDRPTSGGSDRSVGIVLPEDHERLLATLRHQLKSKAYLALLARLQEGQHLILESMGIATERSDWTRFSAAPGEAAEQLHLDMKAIVEVVAIDESHAQQILLDRLQARVAPGNNLLLGTVNYEHGPVVSDYADGLIRFSRQANALAEIHIDAESLRTSLVGMTPAEARARIHDELTLQPGTTPRIEIAPDWPGRMPVLPFRIHIQLAQQA